MKKTQQIVIILAMTVISSFVLAQAPPLEWVVSGGSDDLDYGSNITTDQLGNVYTAGCFRNTVDFDPGFGERELSAFDAFGDAFIQKLDPFGNFVWAISIVGEGVSAPHSITVDDEGNVYVVGRFTQTADFDPGSSVHNLTAFGSAGFLLKLDASGKFMWVQKIGGSGWDEVNSIALDNNGNIYLTGAFWGNVDFDPRLGVMNLSSMGQDDIFITKLNSLGHLVWAKAIGSASIDRGLSIAVDVSQNVYVTGMFLGTMDFDPGPNVDIRELGIESSEDAFVMKLDSLGGFCWANTIGSKSYNRGHELTIDSHGNVVVAGFFFGVVDFDPGPGVFNLTSSLDGNSFHSKDIFIQKLDENGSMIWTKSYGGPSDYDNAWSLDTDIFGNIYVVGDLSETVDFDPGIDTYELESNGGIDIFIQKLDASGNLIWVESIGDLNFEQVRHVALDDQGNIFVTGNFNGELDFDWGVGETKLSSNGNGDFYTAKFTQVFPVAIEELEENNLLQVYPNPTEGIVSLKMDDGNGSIQSVKLVDMLGKEMFQQDFSTGKIEMTIDLSPLKSGIYFVQTLMDTGKSNVDRVVKY